MAAPGGAYCAALRRSQDLYTGEQTHRHADRSARSLQAQRFFSSLHPTSNKLLLLENSLRAVALRSLSCIFFFNGNFTGALFQILSHCSFIRGPLLLGFEWPCNILNESDVLVRKGVAHAKVSECH